LEDKLLGSATSPAKRAVVSTMGFDSSVFRMITEFKGKYDFLSNFYESPVELKGLVFPTAEHAFQAAKAKNPYDMLWVLESRTPGIAKRRGRQVEIKPNWDQDRIGEMLIVVTAKFRNPELRGWLQATHDQKLVEGNYWHDQFWGSCNCSEHADVDGKNYLGKILMYVRKQQRQAPIK
jgi:ribA/ribD-fused uncharacterized protein